MVLASLLAPTAHGEETREKSIILVEFSPELLEATQITLAAWPVELRETSNAAPETSTPGTAAAARLIARHEDADSVAWISQSESGTAMWLYDRETGRVSARRLAGPPPYDEPAAAAVALTLKTLLRHSQIAPQSQRIEPAPPTPTKKPREVPVGSEPSTGSPPTFIVGVGIEGAARLSAPDELSLRARGGVFVGPRWRVGADVLIGFPRSVTVDEVRAEHGTLAAALRGSLRAFSTNAVVVDVSVAAGLALSTLEMTVPTSRVVRRINPIADVAALTSFDVGRGLLVGIEVGARALARRQVFEHNGRRLLKLPRAHAMASLLILFQH